MEVNREILKRALEIVKPGLANKEVQDLHTTAFAFMENKVVTYNQDISISHPVAGLGLTGAVEAKNLYSFLNKLKKDEISFEVKEDKEGGSEVVLECGRAKAGFALAEEINLPLKSLGKKKKEWKELPSDFIKSLLTASECCGHDASRPVLNSVHIKGDIVEASDALRIIRCILNEEMTCDKFLLPYNSAREVVKLNPTTIAESNGWIHFKTEEGTIISCSILGEDDTFPEVDRFLEIEGMDIKLPTSINEVLDRASIFAKKERDVEEIITITLHKGRLRIEAKSETSWFEEEINIRYEDDPFSFQITPYLLREVLRESYECTLSDDKIKFGVDNWTYIAILRSLS